MRCYEVLKQAGEPLTRVVREDLFVSCWAEAGCRLQGADAESAEWNTAGSRLVPDRSVGAFLLGRLGGRHVRAGRCQPHHSRHGKRCSWQGSTLHVNPI